MPRLSRILARQRGEDVAIRIDHDAVPLRVIVAELEPKVPQRASGGLRVNEGGPRREATHHIPSRRYRNCPRGGSYEPARERSRQRRSRIKSTQDRLKLL